MMEREEYFATKRKKRYDAYNRKRAMIDQIVRYTAQGWTQVMIAERIHCGVATISKLMATPTYSTVYRRFSERLDAKVIESLIDIPSEAELALQRIVKRASGVPVSVRKEIVTVDGQEQERIIEESASPQVRQRDDHFLTELHYAKKRQGGGEGGNPYLVDPKTATALQSMAETMRALSDLAATRQTDADPIPVAAASRETPSQEIPVTLSGIWTSTPKRLTVSPDAGD